MIVVYATSATSYFRSISLRGNFFLLPILYCSIATATSPIRNLRLVLFAFTMLSTLQLWTAVGLLITWAEASQDHYMRLGRI